MATSSIPSKKIYFTLRKYLSENPIAQSCRHTTSEAFPVLLSFFTFVIISK